MKLPASIALLLLSGGAFAAETGTQDSGRSLFNASCAFCHGERGHATALLAKRVGKERAPLEKRSDLQPELIRHAVRHGINSMPWYRRAELSDTELNSIIDYLTHPGAK